MIRRLQPDDAHLVTRLRGAALADSPLAFGASPGDDPAQDETAVASWLSRADRSAILGAFDPDCVGMVGVARGKGSKRCHKANVWGLFVVPAHRGKGIARALMQETILLAKAWPKVSVVRLSVNEHCAAARRLYEGLGFQHWGTEPDALRHEDQRYGRAPSLLYVRSGLAHVVGCQSKQG